MTEPLCCRAAQTVRNPRAYWVPLFEVEHASLHAMTGLPAPAASPAMLWSEPHAYDSPDGATLCRCGEPREMTLHIKEAPPA